MRMYTKINRNHYAVKPSERINRLRNWAFLLEAKEADLELIEICATITVNLLHFLTLDNSCLTSKLPNKPKCGQSLA